MSNPAIHNCFFIKRDITDWYEDGSLWDRITGRNGYDSFEGIFPGCYFNLSQNIVAKETGITQISGSRTLIILECNGMMYTGSASLDTSIGTKRLEKPHIVCMPNDNNGFGKVKWNTTASTEGGYYSSHIANDIIGQPATRGDLNGTINEQLYYHLGEHLLTTYERVSNRIDPTSYNRIVSSQNQQIYESQSYRFGASDSFRAMAVQAILMTEIEVYGSIVYSSSGYDTGMGRRNFIGMNFNAYNPNRTSAYWLRDVASSERVCVSDGNQTATIFEPNGTFILKPRIILG